MATSPARALRETTCPITYEAYMANSPDYMADWPDNDQTATVEVDGDTMTLTSSQGQVFMLRRVG